MPCCKRNGGLCAARTDPCERISMWSTDPCTRIGQVGLSLIFHPALYRDLAKVCTRVTETASLLLDGRRLLLCLRGDGHQGLTPPSIPAHLDIGGEFGFHARNTANSRSKRAWFLNSPPISSRRGTDRHLTMEESESLSPQMWCR